MTKANKILGPPKPKLSELKRSVYTLAGVNTTKELKALRKEFASSDFRRKESWEDALSKLIDGQSFEEWCSDPPEKYREIFTEIEKASKEYKEHVASAKKVFKDLEESFEDLDKLTKDAQKEVKALKGEIPISIPISLSNNDKTN